VEKDAGNCLGQEGFDSCSRLSESISRTVRVFGKPGTTREPSGKRPIFRGCLVFFMPLNHNVNGEQVKTRRIRLQRPEVQ
jgi:hypothetical protein